MHTANARAKVKRWRGRQKEGIEYNNTYIERDGPSVLVDKKEPFSKWFLLLCFFLPTYQKRLFRLFFQHCVIDDRLELLFLNELGENAVKILRVRIREVNGVSTGKKNSGRLPAR